MHRTRAERRQWLAAIMAATEGNGKIAVRRLAERVQVNKTTASQMLTKIRWAQVKEAEFFGRILHMLLVRANDDR